LAICSANEGTPPEAPTTSTRYPGLDLALVAYGLQDRWRGRILMFIMTPSARAHEEPERHPPFGG